MKWSKYVIAIHYPSSVPILRTANRSPLFLANKKGREDRHKKGFYMKTVIFDHCFWNFSARLDQKMIERCDLVIVPVKIAVILGVVRW